MLLAGDCMHAWNEQVAVCCNTTCSIRYIIASVDEVKHYKLAACNATVHKFYYAAGAWNLDCAVRGTASAATVR
jgi:hypothetical protein